MARNSRGAEMWSATGMALAGVGLIPENTAPLLHTVITLTALGLFVIAVILTTIIMPGPRARSRFRRSD